MSRTRLAAHDWGRENRAFTYKNPSRDVAFSGRRTNETPASAHPSTEGRTIIEQDQQRAVGDIKFEFLESADCDASPRREDDRGSGSVTNANYSRSCQDLQRVMRGLTNSGCMKLLICRRGLERLRCMRRQHMHRNQEQRKLRPIDAKIERMLELLSLFVPIVFVAAFIRTLQS